MDFTVSSAISEGIPIEGIEKKTGMKLEELFLPSLAIFDLNGSTKEEIIQEMGNLMKEREVVSSGFTESVLEREMLSSTFIGYHSAIPHADPRYVKKPVIAYTRLKNMILWDGHLVRHVFMLALPEDGQEIVSKFYRMLVSDGFEDEMEQLESGQQLLELIRNRTMEFNVFKEVKDEGV